MSLQAKTPCASQDCLVFLHVAVYVGEPETSFFVPTLRRCVSALCRCCEPPLNFEMVTRFLWQCADCKVRKRIEAERHEVEQRDEREYSEAKLSKGMLHVLFIVIVYSSTKERNFYFYEEVDRLTTGPANFFVFLTDVRGLLV